MQNYKTETALWAVMINDPDYMEQLITIAKGSKFEREVWLNNASKWAIKNGFNRLRKSVINLSEKPDFTKTLA